VRALIAGGGTGGHLYPGIAVAEEVIARGGEVLFVGTARGLEARVIPALGHPLELLQVSGLKRMRPLAFARGIARLPVAFGQSLGILRRFRPDVVLGVGGYASGPLVMAAALSGRATALQEQNSVPGFTNRVLGKVAKAAFIAFDEAAGAFPAGKAALTGNPVRRAFLRAAGHGGKAGGGGGAGGAGGGGSGGGGGGGSVPHLLVVGGSQGARAVNDLVLAAVEHWLGPSAGGPMPTVVHQTGGADAERVTAAYQRAGALEGARARVSVRPFIEDMAAAYAAADLVVARAGALTLAELAIMGKPALLIPLPTAADDHQSRNAAAFASAGAALVLPQAATTGADLARVAGELLADGQRRAQMAAAMSALGRPRAAQEIVDRLERLAPRA
jgi:UDP-N-acetylglucosamine--N-acetylmuramyl-(pentapeptide) pyrophosphoryl-undecaprenol N-acetylglucosamine transferase